MHHCRHEWGKKGVVIFWDDHSWFVGVFYWSSSHWNHSDICVIDLEVLVTAHAPFPPSPETELMYSGPVRVFSMIHHVTEKRTVCSCCGHWVCVWWLVMPMRPDRLCWSKAAPDRPMMTRHNNDRSGLFSLISSTDSVPVQPPTSLSTHMALDYLLILFNHGICKPVVVQMIINTPKKPFTVIKLWKGYHIDTMMLFCSNI